MGPVPASVWAKEQQSLKKSRMVCSLAMKNTSSRTCRWAGLSRTCRWAGLSRRWAWAARASHSTSTLRHADGTSRDASYTGEEEKKNKSIVSFIRRRRIQMTGI